MTDGLTREEAECFVRGLYYLAALDGIHDREEQLIRELARETGLELSWEEIAGSSFSPLEAAQVLDRTYLRRIFIKAAVALVKADGTFSDKERHALGEIADAFGIDNAEFGDLEQAAGRASLE